MAKRSVEENYGKIQQFREIFTKPFADPRKNLRISTLNQLLPAIGKFILEAVY
jgi:hypothetical protein